jgi:hypothetical protein
MQGYKWNSVCSSVRKFASNLSNVDFIAGIVFNDSARLLINQRLIDELKGNARRQGAITNTNTNYNRNNPSP